MPDDINPVRPREGILIWAVDYLKKFEVDWYHCFIHLLSSMAWAKKNISHGPEEP